MANCRLAIANEQFHLVCDISVFKTFLVASDRNTILTPLSMRKAKFSLILKAERKTDFLLILSISLSVLASFHQSTLLQKFGKNYSWELLHLPPLSFNNREGLRLVLWTQV